MGDHVLHSKLKNAFLIDLGRRDLSIVMKDLNLTGNWCIRHRRHSYFYFENEEDATFFILKHGGNRIKEIP
jgi:hypothetical protein